MTAKGSLPTFPQCYSRAQGIVLQINLTDELLDGIRRNAWSMLPDEAVASATPTMLPLTERKMLYWLASHLPLGADDVLVDGDAFLGSSSLSLARGLRLNSVAGKDYRIHAYDIFRAPNDGYSQGLINWRPLGSSVLDLYLQNTAEVRPYIAIHEGDVMHMPPPDRPIALLFIDLAKTRDVNSSFNSRFFPHLVAGRSIVVQQDYNDHSCPWIKASMEHLRPYFRRLSDDGGSRIYLYERDIPAGALAQEAKGFDLATEYELLAWAEKREDESFARYFIGASMGWTIFELHGLEAAVDHLKGLAQPWPSETPYIDLIIGAMRWHATPKQMHEHFAGYFGSAAA